MTCTRPIHGWRKHGGGVTFDGTEGFRDKPVQLPCGRCIGCRINRSREWAVRCVHENSLHEESCFITLTYCPEELPEDGGLDVSHWQKFAKRLRKSEGKFRFLHVGEYGDKNQRPHYHALIFGHSFGKDRKLWKEKPHRLYTSETLDKVWGKGSCIIGEVNLQTAGYVAKYCLKKLNGEAAERKYERVDAETGEVFQVRPEYATMSRNPGLGKGWFEKYGRVDVLGDDQVVVDGRAMRPPSYYDSLVEEEELEEIKAKRREYVSKMKDKNTWERLRVKERLYVARSRRPRPV